MSKVEEQNQLVKEQNQLVEEKVEEKVIIEESNTVLEDTVGGPGQQEPFSGESL